MPVRIDFETNVNETVVQVDGLSGKFSGLSKAMNDDANGALKTFGVNLDGLSNPITLVAQGMKAAIDETVKWAGDIDKLSRNTGLTTEEASKLAIVAGDVGIEIGTLERSLKAMNKDGLELNFETLKKVSAQYNATQDPVKRLKIATDNFGSAAQDMTEILSRTPEELDALSDAAERSGRIMSEEAVANAEKFEQSLEQLNDGLKGLQVTVGNVVIPTLLAAGETLSNEAKIAALLAVEFQRATGQIDYHEAAQRAAEIAAGNLTATFQEQIPNIQDVGESMDRTGAATEAAAESQRNMASMTAIMNSTWQSAIPTVSEAVQLNYDLQKAIDAEKADAANKVYGDAMIALQNSNVPLAMKKDLLEDLAILTGQTTAAELANKEAIEFLTKQLELGNITLEQWKQGMDDLTTGATNAHAIVSSLAGVVGSLPPMPYGAEDFAGAGNPNASGVSGGTTNSGTNTTDQYGDQTAAGTGGQWRQVPDGFPNDSFPVWMQSGEQYMVRTPQEINNNHNYGPMTIVLPNVTNAEQFYREMGRQADVRMRV